MIRWLKKVFIPHEGNNHHPHFWRDNSVALLLAIVLVVELGVFAQSFLIFNKDSSLAAILPGVLTLLTNDQRVSNNAPKLVENKLLAEAARLKAEDMAKKGYFAHNSPEGYLPWYWLDRVGYSYAHAGENLAVNYTDSKDVVDAWMNSPTHRANIVKSIYTETGIGMAEGVYKGKQAIFVAQFFGTPGVAVIPVVAKSIASSTTTTSPVKKTVSKPAVVITKTASSSVAATTSNIVSTNTSTTVQVAGAEFDSQVAAPIGLTEYLLASPRHTGTTLLLIFLGVIIVAFLLILLVNGKIHHPKITLTTIAFIVIVIGLIVLNNILLRDKVIVGQGNSMTTHVSL
ncbi:MAG: CAP domain-containing protein [Patescibacteria group bacterium]